MTGTSLDGLDAVLIRCFGSGLEMQFERVVGSVSWELPASTFLRDFASGKTFDAHTIAEASRRFGQAHADAVGALLEHHGVTPELVALHGQTVVHRPPVSWQLIDPWPVAARVGVPVVSDLRSADLAVGGQGAPITPLADWVMFRDPGVTRVVVNLGGFVNATVIPAGEGPESVRGFDVCACNRVLDAAARIVLHEDYDEGGAHALSGEVDGRAAGDLRDMVESQAGAGRSLGSGDECVDWVARWATRVAPADLLATAARTIGSVVGVRVRGAAGEGAELILAGGGARNRALAESIGPATPIESLGVEPHEREAAAMAVLGLLGADGVDVTLPGVTDRSDPAPLTGAWINARPRHR